VIASTNGPFAVGPEVNATDGVFTRTRMTNMCIAPCMFYVPPGKLRLRTRNGDGPVKLDVSPSGLAVTIRAGSTGLFLLGFEASLLAVPGLVGGGILFHQGRTTLGATLMGIGAPLLVAGIALDIYAFPHVVATRSHALASLSVGAAPQLDGAIAFAKGRF